MSFWDFLRNIVRSRPAPRQEPSRSPAPTPSPSPSRPPASGGGSLNPENWEGRPREFLEQIIRPTLQEIGAHSTAAERLLLGTAAAESLLKYRRQMGNGPARGLFQMEPPTHDDIYENFLDYPGRAVLRSKITSLLSSPNADRIKELESNDRYAAAMSRMVYFRRREPLPGADDLDGQAAYWKKYYNTALGAGTVQGYKDKWRQIVGAWPPRF